MEVLGSGIGDGVAQTIVGMITQVVVEELRQIKGVGDKVVHLRDELATMNALLRMLSEADEVSIDHLVREWMKQVRELAYDSEDFVDDFKLRINRRAAPPVDGTALSRAKHLLSCGKLKLDALALRRALAAKIEDLHARTIAVSERRVRYGVDRKALRISASAAFAPASGTSASAQPVNDPVEFIGMDDQATDLASKVSSKGQDMKIKAFSIVGFGGLGKTTLAVEVSRRLEGEFERQANVSVSQAFDENKELKGLLQRILLELVKPRTSNAKGIKEEEYLVVIDDVWTIAAWNAIRCRLPENGCGSRIIVTTRIDTVAKACSPASIWLETIHHIKPLKAEDSKKLFMNRVFGKSNECPEQLEPPMKTILDKCGGLPLAIVNIASLLASYSSANSRDMWDRVCKSIGSQMDSNPTLEGMKQIITLSYSHLPYHLKGCMMYLSIFPEDYVIDKERLLFRWIAEGLVTEKRVRTMLEVAESYFDELISRNMIMPGCRLASAMMGGHCMEANFLTLVGGQGKGASYDKIRRLSIHGDDKGPAEVAKEGSVSNGNETVTDQPLIRQGVEAMNLEHVRSLSMFQPNGHNLLNRLDKFPLLRVLDLEACNKAVKNRHMDIICRLFLLKFLSLKGTDITEVPSEIGGLEHLQMLNLDDTLLTELPDTVTNLEKLECMYMSNRVLWDAVWSLPKGLKRMKALGVVYKADLDSADVAEEICELSQLRGALGNTHALRSINIVENGAGTLRFLLKLPSPPLLLRYLRIAGKIYELPEWIKSLSHLTQINFSDTRLRIDQLLGTICELPSLVDIVLWRISYTDNELVARPSYPFPMLKKISIVSDYDEHKVLKFEEGSMEKLEIVEYRFDSREKKIIGIKNLRNLKAVVLCGNKENPALARTVEELELENKNRPQGKKFSVTLKD
ncbi:hypothetical protein BS78_K044800 [Paspalum vaginatum]|uniref:Uncharacterized protein n=1 Tax=Paspalum vaginatum TaxID=158149 RepID=A0A9W7XC16_9POAL|nr:hypothetical protein BS78_K044800 [Paspalum vaginatum]